MWSRDSPFDISPPKVCDSPTQGRGQTPTIHMKPYYRAPYKPLSLRGFPCGSWDLEGSDMIPPTHRELSHKRNSALPQTTNSICSLSYNRPAAQTANTYRGQPPQASNSSFNNSVAILTQDGLMAWPKIQQRTYPLEMPQGAVLPHFRKGGMD